MSTIAEELASIDLGDQRLNRRAGQVLESLWAKPSASIPGACGGWAETKAAYRLFDHLEVTGQQMLEPHYQASVERMKAHMEIFFRILKSGCRIEKLQLATLERLEPTLAFYLIIVLYLTVLGRCCPELDCEVVFDPDEWQAVYIVTHHQPPPEQPPSLNDMIRMVAGFGGFLNRKGDGFPGPETLWIGLQRCRDFVIAMEAQRALQAQSYG